MKRQTQRSLLMVFVLGALVFCGRAASAGTVTWTGAGANANWSNPTNWDSNPSLPANTDDVVIASGWASGTPAIGGSAGSPVVVNSLTVKDTTTGDVSAGGGGYLQLTGGTINRSANPTEAHSFNFNPSQLYLPPATNNWFLGATGLNFNVMSHIGPIGGSGAMTIVKTGASVLSFYKANMIYAGNWDCTGDLACNATNSLGQGTVTWRGGTWNMNVPMVITNNIVLPTIVNYFFSNGGTFSGIFSGTNCSVWFNTFSSSALTVLSGSNSMNKGSALRVGGGTLRLDAPGLLTPFSEVCMAWNTPTFASLAWNVAETSTNSFRTRQVNGAGYAQLSMNTNGTTTLTGPYSMEGSAADGADLRLSAVAGGTLALAGRISDQKDYNGTTISSPKAHSLTKIGAGTVILSNSGNEYMGGTVVSNGTLLVQNASGTATGTNTVLVCSGATLGGTGRVAGAVSVLPGGTLAPGGTNIVGTLTVSNSVTFAAGSTNIVDIQAGGSDKLSLTGALQLNGAALQVMLPVGFTVPPGTVYTIATGFTGLDTNCFSGLPDGAMVNAGGTALTIHYNTTASPKTITLKRNTGTLIRIN